jgi:DNA-binding NarL/FixJ family response regulator
LHHLHYLEYVARAAVAVIDIMLDPAASIHVCRELSCLRPELPIAALLCCPSSIAYSHLKALIASGVGSLLDLQSTPDEAARALSEMASGHAILEIRGISAQQVLLKSTSESHASPSRSSRLHSTQLDEDDQKLAGAVARGYTDAEIALEMLLSGHTVKHRIERLRNQLGLRNRVELAAWAGREGLYEPDSSPMSVPAPTL